ncbi:unnamed protein product, partial [Ixodes hexagonus]
VQESLCQRWICLGAEARASVQCCCACPRANMKEPSTTRPRQRSAPQKGEKQSLRMTLAALSPAGETLKPKDSMNLGSQLRLHTDVFLLLTGLFSIRKLTFTCVGVSGGPISGGALSPLASSTVTVSLSWLAL